MYVIESVAYLYGVCGWWVYIASPLTTERNRGVVVCAFTNGVGFQCFWIYVEVGALQYSVGDREVSNAVAS